MVMPCSRSARKAVGELGEVDGRVVSDGADVVVVDVAGVVEQAADEGGFAVIDAAGGGETQEVFGAVGGELLLDLRVDMVGQRNDRRFGGRGVSGEHQK